MITKVYLQLYSAFRSFWIASGRVARYDDQQKDLLVLLTTV